MDWRTRSDAELLRNARTDPEAFAVLYQRHEGAVAAFLVQRSRDPELTLDLTAETFATALLRAERFRAPDGDGGGSAVGWLLGIARLLLLQTWRRGRIERRACQALGIESVALSQESLERIEALVDAADPSNPLLRALEALPVDQREAICARVLDERSYDSIAAELGVPQATVRRRVSRGLARLRASARVRFAVDDDGGGVR